MSRQADIKKEKRETAKRNALVKALEYGFVDSLEEHDILLLGFAFRYDAFNSLMTIKGVIGGKRVVAFIGSDSVINCILKASSEAARDTLHWRPDKYQ